MHLSEFEKCEQDLKTLDSLLPGDVNVKRLNEEFIKLKDDAIMKKKKFTKRGLFNLYDEKEEKKTLLPIFDRDNTCFYIDLIFNDDMKNPKKIKFEIFKETKKFCQLFEYLKQSIENKKWKDKEVNNILDTIELDLDYNLNTLPPSEPYLLCIKRSENKNYLIISDQTTTNYDILVLGRCYYNKECLSDIQNRKFKIIDCDYTYNI